MERQHPFPFQRLPVEIRLMVYECIPVEINRHDFTTTSNILTKTHSFTTVSKYVNLSILSTCRQIHAEASAIMQKKLTDILETPPRWIIDLSLNISIHKCGGPLWHMSRCLAKECLKAGKALGGVPYLGTGMGASGARYDPDCDPDYAKLARMTESWFRSIHHQQAKNNSKKPWIEIALVAPRECVPGVRIRALRQYAKTLFEEHGGFEFTLRRVVDQYPVFSDSTTAQEIKAIEVQYIRADAVRAVQGPEIKATEFNQQWCNGGYY